MRPAVRLSRIPALGTIAIVALALALAGCQAASGSPTAAGSAGPTAGPGALKVVTTTTVFADIVQNVGGSRVAATSIIPPGVGPEDYEPKPDDARKLADIGMQWTPASRWNLLLGFVGGFGAGVLASLAAMAVGWALAKYAFEFSWNASPMVPLAGGLAGAVLALTAGWWGLRDVLRRPVVETLRSAAQE